jgi:uncharacterized membrane protein YfcA
VKLVTHIDLIDLPTVSVVALLIGLFVAGATKGLIGVGMPIVAVPILTLVVDLPIVVGLLSIPLIITNVPQALQGDRVAVVLRRLAPILCGLALGVVIGVHLLATVDPVALKPVVGIVLIVIALLMLLSPHLVVPKAAEPFASPVVGLIGGILGGLAALPGPFVFIYLIALGIKRDQFVQHSSMFLAVAATLMAITLGGGGMMGWSDALISAAASLPIFLGMWVGTFVRQFVSPDLFRKLILGVVVLSGVHLSLNGSGTSEARPASASLPICAPGASKSCTN